MRKLSIIFMLVSLLIFLLISLNTFSQTWVKLGEEAPEDISPDDLDIRELYADDDSTYLYFRITVDGAISRPTTTGYYKVWQIQLDVDRDSRNYDDDWDYEYFINIQLSQDTSENPSVKLYTSDGTWVDDGDIIGGGIGSTYWDIRIEKSLFGNDLGNAFYIYMATMLGTLTNPSGYDWTPAASGGSGDYWIYYLSPPSITWSITISDSDDGVTPTNLEICYVREGYDANNLYFEIEVEDNIAWYGGAGQGIYQIYIDADQDMSTGFSIAGIGADYLIEMNVGYMVKLFYFSGTSSIDWSWTFLKREEWINTPNGSTKLTIVTPKSDYTQISLGETIDIAGRTAQDSTTKDITSSSPAPIPENPIVSIIPLTLTIIILTLYRRHWPKYVKKSCINFHRFKILDLRDSKIFIVISVNNFIKD